jgi:ATP-dependent Clp protease adapter protein ClpS
MTGVRVEEPIKRKEKTMKNKTKQYRVWTENGSWDFIAGEEYLKELLMAYTNFHYELVEV